MRWRPSQLIPRRRWQRVLAALLPLLVLAWFVVPQAFVPTIRAKLQGMISGRLDARLDIGRLMYAPPFGVRARDVRLVSNASLPGWKGDVELLRVAKLDLKLAHLPFKKGPLVIQNITVTDPEVHLIRAEDGRLIGMHSVVKPQPPQGEPATQPSTQPAIGIEGPEEASRAAAGARLSDMFELRHFGISGGRVVYEDRTAPGLPPVVWKDLNAGMETSQHSKAQYGFKFEASNGDLAKLNSSGSFDLDALTADVGDLHVEARTAYTDDQSPLPAQVQRVLRDYRVQGHVTLDAGGHFALREREANTYHASLALRDASAYWPRWDASLDRLSVKLSADNEDANAAGQNASTRGLRPVRLRLEALDATSGDAAFRLEKAQAVVDPGSNSWDLAQVAARLELAPARGAVPKDLPPALARSVSAGRVDFTVSASGRLRPGPGGQMLAPEDVAFLAYPRGLTFRVPKWPAPIQDLGGGGTVRKDRGSRVVLFDNLTFAYGGDPIVLTSARLPLPADLRDLRKETRVEEISGTIDFHRPGPRYPGWFGKVVAALRPVGSFAIGRDSWYAITAVEPPLRVRAEVAAPPALPPRRKSDYFFSVSSDDASFTLTDRRIELTKMSGDATVSNMLIDVRRLEADVLGGRISGGMRVTPGQITKYQGRAFVRGLDLDALSRRLILPETRDSKLTGLGNLNVDFLIANPGGKDEPVLAHTRASGEFEVLRGDFWTIPVLGDVAGRVRDRPGRDARGPGTVGEAAGVFEIQDGTLVLRDAAVSSPALGVVGSGTVGLVGDKRLDLRIVAAPLGDWRDKVKQTRVPILSDVAGEVFGAAQKIVNTATSTLLYEFRVTGTIQDRHVATVPVPALTEPAALLFGRMLRGENDAKLLETMKGAPNQEPPRSDARQSK